MPQQKQVVNTLIALGYKSDIIQRAFKVYIKNYGDQYNIEVLVEIITRLQIKDAHDISQSQHNYKSAVGSKTITFPIKINVDVEFNLMAGKKESIVVDASYDEKETIGDVADRIINRLNVKYHPMTFAMSIIEQNLLIKTKIFYYDEQHRQYLNEPITRHAKDAILKHGLQVKVYLNKFIHKITANNISCQYMINNKTINPMKCPIYTKMKHEYEFTQDNLDHVNQFTHYKDEYMEKPECKFSDECKTYKRLEEGGNKLDDLCHIKLFKHPPRGRNIKLQNNINSLIVNKNQRQNHPLYKPTKKDNKKKINKNDGYLIHLIEEVISNGFKSDLCLTDENFDNNEYSILKIVDDKLKSNRHAIMGSPLTRANMLALILYTGCDCNYDLCKSQRNGDYEKWEWLDYCLYHAIHKLSKRETGQFDVFSGLNKVKLDTKSIKCGYFVTYVSTSWSKQVANAFMHDEGMMLQINESFKNSRLVTCCDVSWISKFPDECEILFARSIYDDKYPIGFECRILDEQNGIQTASLNQSTEVIIK